MTETGTLVSKLKKKQRQNVLLNIVSFWTSIPSHSSYTIEIPSDEFSILFVNNIRLGWWGVPGIAPLAV